MPKCSANRNLEVRRKTIAKCDLGAVVTTQAYDLPAHAVIHAVGPRYLDGTCDEADLLRSTYMAIAK